MRPLLEIADFLRATLPSQAMRARLCGFEFNLQDGSLQPLETSADASRRSSHGSE